MPARAFAHAAVRSPRAHLPARRRYKARRPRPSRATLRSKIAPSGCFVNTAIRRRGERSVDDPRDMTAAGPERSPCRRGCCCCASSPTASGAGPASPGSPASTQVRVQFCCAVFFLARVCTRDGTVTQLEDPVLATLAGRSTRAECSSISGPEYFRAAQFTRECADEGAGTGFALRLEIKQRLSGGLE